MMTKQKIDDNAKAVFVAGIAAAAVLVGGLIFTRPPSPDCAMAAVASARGDGSRYYVWTCK